jgi:hypothetical protein
MLLKGDRVMLSCGRTGEVLDIWGFAMTFARIKLDTSNQTIPVMASDIISNTRPVKSIAKGGAPREKRKKTNQTPEGSDRLHESQLQQLAGL